MLALRRTLIPVGVLIALGVTSASASNESVDVATKIRRAMDAQPGYRVVVSSTGSMMIVDVDHARHLVRLVSRVATRPLALYRDDARGVDYELVESRWVPIADRSGSRWPLDLRKLFGHFDATESLGGNQFYARGGGPGKGAPFWMRCIYDERSSLLALCQGASGIVYRYGSYGERIVPSPPRSR